MFAKEERSSFPYWAAHWCAFQMTALNHRMWKPKYLFHDWEKPWLRIFLPYEKVQKLHRHRHNHHLEWLDDQLWNCQFKDGDIRKVLDRFDWEAMMIDWECSRFTKEASPKTAREQVHDMWTLKGLGKYPSILGWCDIVRERIDHTLDKYGF